MIIEGINFNKEWAKSVSEKKFVNHFLPIHFQELEINKREEKLKGVYAILNPKSEI